jgi:hypothetical protein
MTDLFAVVDHDPSASFRRFVSLRDVEERAIRLAEELNTANESEDRFRAYRLVPVRPSEEDR